MSKQHKTRQHSIMVLDMSFTLSMFRERQLEQALEIRKLEGYFTNVISVHPLASLFSPDNDSRFGRPKITTLDNSHMFVEGTVGLSKAIAWMPPVNLFFAQIALLRVLIKLARESNVTVIRIGDPYFLGVVGLVLSRILRVPLVARICFDYDLLYKTSGKPVFPRLFRARWIEKMVERFVLPRCDLVAGANQTNLNYAIRNGAREDRGVVFYYGNLIHPIHFSPPSSRGGLDQIRDDIGLTGKFAITVSRLEPMKQPDHTIRAFAFLCRHETQLQLIVIGDGSLKDELVTLACELRIDDRVIFVGNRSQEFIATLLPKANVVFSPHMGRGLTEACLAAAPIVAYDYDWQREVIRNEETGLLVHDGDWMAMSRCALRLTQNRQYASRLGGEARKHVLRLMDPAALTRLEISSYDKILN